MTAASDPAVSDVVDLRTTPGAVEIDRDAIRVAGPEAVDYLQGQLSQDVAALAVGATTWSFVLQPAGKVDAWLRATRTGDDALVLDVDGGHGEAVVARLRRFLLRTKADVDALAWRCVAVRGPGAGQATSGAPAEVAAPAGWPGVEGVDLLGPQVQGPDGVAAVDRLAYDSLRVRCGVPLMGAELTEATIPAEMGQWVIDEAVSFTKGCFTGQELVARIDSRGGNVPRRLRGLVVTGDQAPPMGAAVVVDGGEVGQVTSVAPRPGGGSVALAVVRRGVSPPTVAEVGVAGDNVTATVVDLPIES